MALIDRKALGCSITITAFLSMRLDYRTLGIKAVQLMRLSEDYANLGFDALHKGQYEQVTVAYESYRLLIRLAYTTDYELEG